MVGNHGGLPGAVTSDCKSGVCQVSRRFQTRVNKRQKARRRSTERVKRQCISTEVERMKLRPQTSEITPDQEMGFLSLQDVYFSLQSTKKKIFSTSHCQPRYKTSLPTQAKQNDQLLYESCNQKLKTEQFSEPKWHLTKQATCQLPKSREVEHPERR